MSLYNIKLCSVVLKQVFGDIIQKIGDELLNSPSRTFHSIFKLTKLPKQEISRGLSILIKFGLVKFFKSQTNENEVEYSIIKENILFILKYSKYVYHIQTKYGNVAASIIEELLRLGSETDMLLISKCFINADSKDNLRSYRDMFISLVNEQYIIKQPSFEIIDKDNFILSREVNLNFEVPEIDLLILQEMLTSPKPKKQSFEKYWTVNFAKFHQDFKELLIISAIDNKLGNAAGECIKLIFKLIYTKTSAFKENYSNTFTLIEIKKNLNKRKNSSDVIKNIDNYVTIIAEDSLGFLQKISETGGGEFVINYQKGFEGLVFICIENIINEKLGAKAARIYRIIRSKQYIEQEEIQKEAMIPAKEAKLLTYNLYQENFIQLKTIRKVGGVIGPTKTFFLFCTSLTPVVNMLLDQCCKSLCNIVVRSTYDKFKNKRLIDKSQKLNSIVETIKERGESEEYIAEILETLTPVEREILKKVKHHIRLSSTAEIILENTIFLLQLYKYYSCKSK